MCSTPKVFYTLAILMLTAVLSSAQNCIYPSANLYIQNTNCTPTVALCLDIPFADRTDYDIYVDGALYTGTQNPCNYDTLRWYNVEVLSDYIAMATNPDMVVDSVRINGALYSFSFADVTALADSINAVDLTSSWVHNVADKTIEFGNNASTYGNIYFRDLTNNSRLQSDIQQKSTPNGLELEIANGFSQLVLNEITTTCRDTVAVEVFCVSQDILWDTLSLNIIDTICFSFNDLRGAVVNIENICPAESGDFALIDVINGTSCVEVTGLDVGRDSACIVIEDSEGLRDTIIYIVQVLDRIDPGDFFAADDFISTNVNTAIIFNPTSNDGIIGTLDSMFISGQPSNGTAQVNPDGAIIYQPDPGYLSDRTADTLSYTICQQSICRTATVWIDVGLPEIDISSGFSPNNDGINDFFIINNLDRYSSNDLLIFNRWGNQVYQADNYQNDWDGRWDNATDLPDGPYFYILNVTSRTASTRFTGFIFLQR